MNRLLSCLAILLLAASCGAKSNLVEFNDFVVKECSTVAEAQATFEEMLFLSMGEANYASIKKDIETATATIEASMAALQAKETPEGSEGFKAAALNMMATTKMFVGSASKLSELDNSASRLEVVRLKQHYQLNQNKFISSKRKLEDAQRVFARENNIRLN